MNDDHPTDYHHSSRFSSTSATSTTTTTTTMIRLPRTIFKTTFHDHGGFFHAKTHLFITFFSVTVYTPLCAALHHRILLLAMHLAPSLALLFPFLSGGYLLGG